METKYSLVLTGSVLPGFAPESVWPALAQYFRMEPDKLTEQLLARAPLTIKESEDLGKLQTLQAGAAAAGAEAEICAPDGRPGLFVLLDGKPRGPVPRVLVEERVDHGIWPAGVMVAEVGSSAWHAFAGSAPRAEAPAADAAVDEPDFAAGGDRPAGHAPTSAADQGRAFAATLAVGDSENAAAAGALPPGAAIHAGFWRRCAAYVIDYFITLVGSWIVGFIAGMALAFGQGARALVTGPLLGAALGIVIGWLYFALQESSAQQATLGKRALGIKVVDGHGRRIGFGRASGRFFGKILSGIILSIGFMMAGWTARKQALHDMLADTLVVFRGVEPGQPLPSLRPPMPWYGWALNILIVVGSILAIVAYVSFLRTLMSAAIPATPQGF